MSLNSSDSLVQIPIGFRSCTRPFGRLLASFDISYAQRTESRLNGPLQWLLDNVAKNEEDDSQKIKEVRMKKRRQYVNIILNYSFILFVCSITGLFS